MLGRHRRRWPVSIQPNSQYFILAGTRAHSACCAATDSEMKVTARFTSVHIPSFGRAVTGNAADSEMEV